MSGEGFSLSRGPLGTARLWPTSARLSESPRPQSAGFARRISHRPRHSRESPGSSRRRSTTPGRRGIFNRDRRPSRGRRRAEPPYGLTPIVAPS